MSIGPNPIRVVLVDDHEVVRTGLKHLLSEFPRLHVVGEAGSAAQAVSETLRLKPDVLLLDIRLPDGDGMSVSRQILQDMEDPPKIVILTSFSDENLIFEAISAGVDGYLLKDINSDQLIQALVAVAEGKSILDPAVTRRVLARIKSEKEQGAEDKLALLSAQERRVLALVAEGKTNKEIALAMNLSNKTVKNYLSHVLNKLGLLRRTQAAVLYSQMAQK